MLYSVIAAKDGDTYHDQVEAADQEEAEELARTQLAEAWHMTDTLQSYIDEGDPEGFAGELDGFAVDPVRGADKLAELLGLIDSIDRDDDGDAMLDSGGLDQLKALAIAVREAA